MRDEVYDHFNQPVILSNIRVVCEAMKHEHNAVSIIQSCALHGTRNLSFTPHSIDPFVPTVLHQTDCALVTFPIYQNVNYEEYPFVREGVPPMIVLMEGDPEKETVGHFYLPSIDEHLTPEQKADQRIIQMVQYDGIDWTYPNIVLVIGQESRGLSYAIASKGTGWNAT